MEEHNIHKIMLEQYVRRLFKISGKLNLYVNAHRQGHKPYIKRIKSDIQMIEDLAANIKLEIDNI